MNEGILGNYAIQFVKIVAYKRVEGMGVAKSLVKYGIYSLGEARLLNI